MKLITIVDNKKKPSHVARKFQEVLFRNKIISELMAAQDDIISRYNITSLPAAILDTNKIIYQREMEDYILRAGNVSHKAMI